MSADDGIWVWPDGSWCHEDELEESLRYKSDDVAFLKYDGRDPEDMVAEYMQPSELHP